MKLKEAYRSWADQHPDEARWVVWVWIPAVAVIGFGAWTWLGDRGDERDRLSGAPEMPKVSAGPPAFSPALVRQIEDEYPADPEMWTAAASRLGPARAEEAATLARDAELFVDPAAGRKAAPSPLAAAIAQLESGGIPAALAWLDRQPSDGPAQLRAFRADLLARRRLLPELRAALERGAWGPADADTLDLAFAAAGVRDRQHADLEQDLWTAAMQICAADRAKLRVLERLALGLGLDAETAATFQAETALQSADLPAVRRQAIWAARHEIRSWPIALGRWRAAAPAEADNYARALERRKASGP